MVAPSSKRLIRARTTPTGLRIAGTPSPQGVLGRTVSDLEAVPQNLCHEKEIVVHAGSEEFGRGFRALSYRAGAEASSREASHGSGTPGCTGRDVRSLSPITSVALVRHSPRPMPAVLKGARRGVIRSASPSARSRCPPAP